MSSKSKKTEPRQKPRLYLVTPPTVDQEFLPRLEEALDHTDLASLLIWGETAEGKTYAERAKLFTPVIQKYNVAALLRADAQLVARTGADGFHADGSLDNLRETTQQLQPKLIVGAGNLRSTHEAMSAGEANADYIFFGNLTPHDTRGNDLALLCDRASWWQSLFEIPCVAYASKLEDVAPLAKAGADFIALREALWSTEFIGTTLKQLEQELHDISQGAAA